MDVDWRDIRYDSLLFLFGFFCLLGSFSPWEVAGEVFYNALGAWQGNASFLGSWLIIFAALSEMGVIKELADYKPYGGSWLGIIGSVFVLTGSISFYFGGTSAASNAFGLYIPIIFGFASLFSTIMIYNELSEGGKKFRGGEGRPDR